MEGVVREGNSFFWFAQHEHSLIGGIDFVKKTFFEGSNLMRRGVPGGFASCKMMR